VTELAKLPDRCQTVPSHAEKRDDLLAQVLEKYGNVESRQVCLPNVFRYENVSTFRYVVFSIRPPHAEKILAGKKTIELRRRFADDPGALALIYTTSPTCALTGPTRSAIDCWKLYRAAACVPKGAFEDYFSGRKCSYAIMLAFARPLARPVGLSELREQFAG
jgi:predicted transcriptional regulator